MWHDLQTMEFEPEVTTSSQQALMEQLGFTGKYNCSNLCAL